MGDARLEIQHHAPGPWPDTLAQLDRIERKLDRLTAILERQENRACCGCVNGQRCSCICHRKAVAGG